jgi:hypothetical protein
LLGCILYYVSNKLTRYETFDKRHCQNFIQIALVPPRRRGSPCSFIMYVFCSGLCENVDNLRRMWKWRKSTCSIFKSISGTILYTGWFWNKFGKKTIIGDDVKKSLTKNFSYKSFFVQMIENLVKIASTLLSWLPDYLGSLATIIIKGHKCNLSLDHFHRNIYKAVCLHLWSWCNNGC